MICHVVSLTSLLSGPRPSVWPSGRESLGLCAPPRAGAEVGVSRGNRSFLLKGGGQSFSVVVPGVPPCTAALSRGRDRPRVQIGWLPPDLAQQTGSHSGAGHLASSSRSRLNGISHVQPEALARAVGSGPGLWWDSLRLVPSPKGAL